MTPEQSAIAAQLEGERAAGTLSAEGLREGLAAFCADRRQDLLYLHAISTSPSSQIVAMTRVAGGKIVEPPAAPDDGTAARQAPLSLAQQQRAFIDGLAHALTPRASGA